MSIEYFSDRPPSWIELESALGMPQVEKITGLSGDTIRRTYPEYVVKLSARRDGMQLKNALAIANGTARQV